MYFGIISHPFDALKLMLFISFDKEFSIQNDKLNSKEYVDISKKIKDIGFSEVEPFCFESTINLSEKEVVIKLKSLGMIHDKKFGYHVQPEANRIQNELSNLLTNLNKHKESESEFFLEQGGDIRFLSLENDKSLIFRRSDIIKDGDNPKTKKPLNKDEEIELNFYLYLAAYSKKTEDGSYIFDFEFSGDMYEKKDHANRKFLKIFTSRFKRINDGPHRIKLESVDDFGTMLEELDCLFNLDFEKFEFDSNFMKDIRIEDMEEAMDGKKNINPFKSYRYHFNIMEIKPMMDTSRKLLIELDIKNSTTYFHLIKRSREIKEELKRLKENTVMNKNGIFDEVYEVFYELDDRRQKMSDSENYEEAMWFKTILNKMQEKIDFLSRYKKEMISLPQYEKYFKVGKLTN